MKLSGITLELSATDLSSFLGCRHRMGRDMSVAHDAEKKPWVPNDPLLEVAAAREAGDAGFDMQIACAFNYEAHSTEFSKLGRLPVLKARMNADLHMAEDLKPQGGEVISDGADGSARWFVDTDYNEESFLVRHAYFLGANDLYSAFKTTLKAEIDPDAWTSLNSDTSRPFEKPTKGRIAVKVISHLGDEVMKVFKV
jgi:adenine-specific DNA-methyltransferase